MRATDGSNPKPASRLRIIVLGYLVRGPLGGMAWHHLQYVVGLARLGHDVYFIEDSDDYASCYDPQSGMTCDPSYGLQFARDLFDRVGLGDRWAYYDAHRPQWYGPCSGTALSLCATADLLINVSGVNPMREWFMSVPARVLVDTDPAFTQIRHLTNPEALRTARSHTAFLSFGENIGQPGCGIPYDDLPWKPTRQPIVLDMWEATSGPSDGSFTTVMQWDSYPSRNYAGLSYGMKSASFPPYLDIPTVTSGRFELALGGTSAPRKMLTDHGWAVVDPQQISADPSNYQDYIRRSKAEFTVAKHGYVSSNSGWFSERTAAYLASGRPAVVQETGFTRSLPSGKGLFSFRDLGEAVAGIDQINQNYGTHCRAAREIAEEFFDSDTVLDRVIEVGMQRNSLQVETAI
jgi:hypothetical protein